ncbi:MAG: metal ABC transporter substrate-binding protein [Lachnobacterium sp.]|nr:metal ABC transporter substrate-binding protein [Lachnobacterium sp.]
MKKNKYVFVLVMLVVITVVSGLLTNIYVRESGSKQEEQTLTVVTSFYPMYIAALNVIGDTDGVHLQNLSEPQTGCLHDFQLTPEDMKLLSKADVFIINGGGIESFMKDVAKSYPDLTIIEASEGIDLLEDEGEENAHAWMSVATYEEQVNHIAEGLAAADEKHASDYQKHADAYVVKLDALKERQQKVAEKIKGQSVILFHEAYDYVADDYGLNVAYVLDLDEERQVSAGEVADVLAAVRDDHVKYILAEELYGKSMGDTVEKETDAKVIYLDALNRGDYDADSYIKGMSANIGLIEQYLTQN